MSDGINLLSRKTREQPVTRNYLLPFRIISFGLLMVVFLASLVLFVLKLQSPLESLKREEQSLLNNISVLDQKRGQYAFLNDRLKNISEILKTRPAFSEVLDTFSTIIPAGVNLSGISLDKKTAKVTFESNNLTEINNMLEATIALMQNDTTFAQRVALDELNYDNRRQVYSVAVLIDIE